GGAASATLVNVDNAISGAGQIGAGQMILLNSGIIVANGSHALVIDTGSNVVVNTGSLEASGSGVLVVDSVVGGHGSAAIGGHGTIEFGAASDANVGFAGDAAGTLTLDHSAGFSGTISGLNADDTLHFGDMMFSPAAQLSYTANAAGTAGALVVSDGTQTARISLIGHYAAADFQLAAGASGSTDIVNTATNNATVLGTAGADSLVGTAGNDIIVGGAGSDTLTGGAGVDTFMFRSSDGGAVDTITDFDAGAAGDMLNIGALLRGYASGADMSAFVDLRVQGSDTIVAIDLDGAGSANGYADLLVLQGLTGLDFGTLIAHIDPNPLP
ncbi:MAG: type I secretion C-terminal target domain-containing protein, partial [Burkholderiaceae bacterium]